MIDRENSHEIVHTVLRLREALDELTVRGLSAAGEADLKVLSATHGELERIGAVHLAGRLGDLVDRISGGGSTPSESTPGSSLLRAQTSLRLFERLLTREVVTGEIEAALGSSEEEL